MTVPLVFLDACVLFPTLVRRIVLGAAARGVFVPRWSPRVLDEWQIAIARKKGADAEDEVLAAREQMAAAFPGALFAPDAEIEANLDLPDPDDTHVAAAAAGSDILLTFNTRDFPRRTLATLGVEVRHPDGYLWECWSRNPEEMGAAIQTAATDTGIDRDAVRAALKRARLSRLGKAATSTD